MNYSRLALAALGGTVASFAFGFLVLALVPALFEEVQKYPAVFRPKDEMMSVMPFGFLAAFISVVVVTIIYALSYHGGSGITQGARLGILVGIFAVCNVLHNFVNFQIGGRLAVGQAVTYLIQWTITGIVIGLIYKPLTP